MSEITNLSFWSDVLFWQIDSAAERSDEIFSYSEAEIVEVREALNALSPGAGDSIFFPPTISIFNELRDRSKTPPRCPSVTVSLEIWQLATSGPAGWRERHKELRDRINELTKARMAVNSLLAFTQPRVDHVENLWLSEEASRFDQAAVAADIAIKELATHLDEQKQALEALVSEKEPLGSQNNNYRNALFDAIARTWVSHGGEVNFGEPYRRFFEAVAKPPLMSKIIQQKFGVIWAPRTLKTHVENWKP